VAKVFDEVLQLSSSEWVIRLDGMAANGLGYGVLSET
jgi:hypothetical protein